MSRSKNAWFGRDRSLSIKIWIVRYLTLCWVRYLKEECMEVLKLILAIIATEAATNLITKSEFSIRFIKEPLFNLRRFKVFDFIHEILECGYCTSVWAGGIFALLFLTDALFFVVLLLVFHRMANVLHFLIDWLDEKRPRDLDFTSKGEDNEWIRKEHDPSVVTHDEENGGAGRKDSVR